MTDQKIERILEGFAGPFKHNRMRAVIYTKRMVYDYMEADQDKGDNCPEWLFPKLYVILQAKIRR